jgi:hypothetical protein
LIKPRSKLLLLWLRQLLSIDFAVIFVAVFTLLDRDNVRGTAKSREQIRSITGGEEFAQVIGSVCETKNIILDHSPGHWGENSADEIMGEAVPAEMHLQSIRDEG